jgi:acyl-CoA synthetase (NDP forming)
MNTHELRRFFTPTNVAVVGAKDGSVLSLGVVEALERVGFGGTVFPVSRSGGVVHGRPAAVRCSDIGEPVDVAILLAPAPAVPDVLDDVAAAGIAGAVVLASGWGETGSDGKTRETALVAQAHRLGVTVLGPNCLGFMNFSAATGAWIAAMPPNVVPGTVALMSQSGGIGGAMVELAAELGIGLSHLVTTGNEAVVSGTDVLGYLVDDEASSVIAMFVEGIQHPRRFLEHLDRAARQGKAVVVFKAGSSELAADNARSHTGSLVGDDAVVDAALRQHGAIRVQSLEELVVTAGLIAHTGSLRRTGIAVVSMSGGSCGIVADHAERVGLKLPQFDEAAVGALSEVLPDFASIRNPLDITGGALENELADVLAVLDKQDDIGVIAVVVVVPVSDSCKLPVVQHLLETVGRAMGSISKPTVAVTQTAAHLNAFAREVLSRAGVPATLPGLSAATEALRNVSRWSAFVARGARAPGPDTPVRLDVPTASGPLSEWRSRQLLAAAGVPLVPATLVTDVDAAVAAAADTGRAVAVKLVSSDVVHKSDAGAVRLGVDGADAVRAAFESVVAAGWADRPDLHPEGVLIAPMRSGGVELLVGVSCDPQWGPVLAVGMGGILVEVLDDVATRLLPVTAADVREMLDDLRGVPLLRGARGSAPVAIEPLVDAILAVARAGLALGSRLESLDVNPLRADAAGCEALDALVVLRTEAP